MVYEKMFKTRFVMVYRLDVSLQYEVNQTDVHERTHNATQQRWCWGRQADHSSFLFCAGV